MSREYAYLLEGQNKISKNNKHNTLLNDHGV